VIKRLLDLFKSSSASVASPAADSASETAFTLRTLDTARKFPVLLSPTQAPGLHVGSNHQCKSCGATCTHVVITTWGVTGLPETWLAHPVALEGLSCPKCQDLAWPARLPTALADEINQQGVDAARSGDFDRAEFLFRRLVNSYPASAPFRTNLGSVYLDKRRAAQQGGGPPELLHLYGERTREIFVSVLECPGPIDSRVPLSLARIYRSYKQFPEALKYLALVLDNPNAPQQAISEARALKDQVLGGMGAEA